MKVTINTSPTELINYSPKPRSIINMTLQPKPEILLCCKEKTL